jgi:uncharacterized protein (TIGR00251 family)
MDEHLFTERDGAVTFRVAVKPKARINGVEGVRAGALLIHVTAAPDRGEANRAVVETLAEWAGVPRSQVEISAGARSRHKTIRILACTEQKLRQLVASLTEGH